MKGGGKLIMDPIVEDENVESSIEVDSNVETPQEVDSSENPTDEPVVEGNEPSDTEEETEDGVDSKKTE